MKKLFNKIQNKMNGLASIMRMMKIRMPIDRPHLKGFFES